MDGSFITSLWIYDKTIVYCSIIERKTNAEVRRGRQFKRMGSMGFAQCRFSERCRKPLGAFDVDWLRLWLDCFCFLAIYYRDHQASTHLAICLLSPLTFLDGFPLASHAYYGSKRNQSWQDFIIIWLFFSLLRMWCATCRHIFRRRQRLPTRLKMNHHSGMSEPVRPIRPKFPNNRSRRINNSDGTAEARHQHRPKFLGINIISSSRHYLVVQCSQRHRRRDHLPCRPTVRDWFKSSWNKTQPCCRSWRTGLRKGRRAVLFYQMTSAKRTSVMGIIISNNRPGWRIATAQAVLSIITRFRDIKSDRRRTSLSS